VWPRWLTDALSGKLSLPRAFWIWGVGVSVAYSLIGAFIDVENILALTVYLGVGLALGILQTVILWRCASNSRSKFLVGLVRTVVIIGLILAALTLYVVLTSPSLVLPSQLWTRALLLWGDAMQTIQSSRDVIVRTPAWNEAVRFYEQVLGFAASSRAEGMVGFETGSFCLYLEKGAAHGPVFDFLVSDVGATRDRLLKAGCTLIEEDPSVPRCYLRDPYGLTFNVGRKP
jgi:predicted enzyme related to lactoylglutathione lyase